MEFGAEPVTDATGSILAHSVMAAGSRIRKGQLLTEALVATLKAAGIASVVVARLGPQDVNENEAATRIAAALVPDPARAGLRLSKSATGRVNIFAEANGVADIDAEKINALNRVDPMITVATVAPYTRMSPRAMVATIKIISYGVDTALVEAACAAGHDALTMHPPVFPTVSFIQTTVAGGDTGRGHIATQKRVEELGLAFVKEPPVAHEVAALRDGIMAARGAAILILTASATSDIRDTAPEALRAAGGEVTYFGMPVDPGNLLFFGKIGDRPVIGLPGCARSPALNGADWVMERILCGIPVTGADIAAMGVGGLLKEIPTRPQPRDG